MFLERATWVKNKFVLTCFYKNSPEKKRFFTNLVIIVQYDGVLTNLLKILKLRTEAARMQKFSIVAFSSKKLERSKHIPLSVKIVCESISLEFICIVKKTRK